MKPNGGIIITANGMLNPTYSSAIYFYIYMFIFIIVNNVNQNFYKLEYIYAITFT